MDQSVLSYYIIYRMDQSILNSIFKIWSDGLKHSSDGPWLVAMGIDYYLSIAMGIEEEAIKKEEATGSCS
jgi:hypothetical protein